MLFDVSTSEHQGWLVLAVRGELDVATAPRLRQEAVRALATGATRLAIDLSGCAFLDSTGLGVVVGLLKRVRGFDGALVIVGALPQVAKVFEITRVDSIVPLVASLDEADAVSAGQG